VVILQFHPQGMILRVGPILEIVQSCLRWFGYDGENM